MFIKHESYIVNAEDIYGTIYQMLGKYLKIKQIGTTNLEYVFRYPELSAAAFMTYYLHYSVQYLHYSVHYLHYPVQYLHYSVPTLLSSVPTLLSSVPTLLSSLPTLLSSVPTLLS